MPAQERIHPAAVIERLLAQPQAFGFFQALRLLERHNAHAGPAQAIDVRFRNSVAVGFPASEIEAVDTLSTGSRHSDAAPNAPAGADTASPDSPASRAWDTLRITPAFMSLLGAHGALPLAYTEKVAARETYQRDRAPRAFLDIFFDRLCVLMHEAWKKYRPAIRYETDPRDEFTPLLLALAGLGGPALRSRLGDEDAGVHDESLAYYAAALRQRPPSAEWLGAVAADYFGVAIRVEPFVGRWYAIPTAHRAVLGMGAGLGTQSVIGERVFQRDLCLRLHIGPLAESDYQRFLPGGQGCADLERLLGLLTGASFEYEVKLSLKPEAVQPAQLGQAGRLGWDAFVLSAVATSPRHDAGYALTPLAASQRASTRQSRGRDAGAAQVNRVAEGAGRPPHGPHPSPPIGSAPARTAQQAALSA